MDVGFTDYFVWFTVVICCFNFVGCFVTVDCLTVLCCWDRGWVINCDLLLTVCFVAFCCFMVLLLL